MKSRIFFVLALLCIAHSAGAVRVLRQLEQPFELSVSQLNLPTDALGTMTFKMCADCRTEIRRLSGDTAFMLNDRAVDFATFRQVVTDLRSRTASANHPAAVFVDIATGRVTRLSVHAKP
jgi:hypothetical protein